MNPTESLARIARTRGKAKRASLTRVTELDGPFAQATALAEALIGLIRDEPLTPLAGLFRRVEAEG